MLHVLYCHNNSCKFTVDFGDEPNLTWNNSWQLNTKCVYILYCIFVISSGARICGARSKRLSCRPSLPEVPAILRVGSSPACVWSGAPRPKTNSVHFKHNRTPVHGRMSRAVKHLNDHTQAYNFLSSLKCRPLECAPSPPPPPPRPAATVYHLSSLHLLNHYIILYYIIFYRFVGHTTGPRTYYLMDDLARLEDALVCFTLDTLLKKHVSLAFFVTFQKTELMKLFFVQRCDDGFCLQIFCHILHFTQHVTDTANMLFTVSNKQP